MRKDGTAKNRARSLPVRLRNERRGLAWRLRRGERAGRLISLISENKSNLLRQEKKSPRADICGKRPQGRQRFKPPTSRSLGHAVPTLRSGRIGERTP